MINIKRNNIILLFQKNIVNTEYIPILFYLNINSPYYCCTIYSSENVDINLFFFIIFYILHFFKITK